ncbi:MAG: acetyl-CoA carboxylase carboxyltransferase subunit alpha, partial [Spirochaetes bacterium]|nr:acetyl-CoA carboxylase carboxyltransferase subunit alpha [Spirochaetota bacterium]
MLDFEKPIYDLQEKISELRKSSVDHPDIKINKEISELEKKLDKLKQNIFKNLTPWQEVQLARHPQRPYFLDYVKLIFTDFIELHGDRAFKDDRAVITGFASLDKFNVMLIGQQKGRTIEDNIIYNFGMMHPEGYRKALRLMKLAEKFNKPIITFIDTQGAYPGMDAEERGQAEAIAKNLLEMSLLRVPIISVVIGEGGSGGALGIGVTNIILMMENSVYSVITPEGCASILWHDATKADQASSALKITARDLYSFGIIDKIVPEPVGGAHTDYQTAADNLKKELLASLKKLSKVRPEEL